MTKFHYAALCAVPLAVLAAAPVHAAPLTEFYKTPVPDAAQYSNGDIIDSLDGAGFGLGILNTKRILYKTTNTHGDATVVSGYTMTPSVAWIGPGPRPVVAFAPGTSGMADRCAGSMALETTAPYPAVLPLLLAGYSVAATDYVGLGTPGGHTYLNRLDAGHALLDVARAGVGDTGAPVVMFGYSEGGHAAGAAAELASSYAPELDIRGTYVGAPPADPALNSENVDNTPMSSTLLYSIEGLTTAYPEHASAIRSQLNQRGLDALDAVQNSCSTDPAASDTLHSSDLTVDGRSLAEHSKDQPNASLNIENTVGYGLPSAPVLLAQSAEDDTVRVAQSRTLRDRWSAAGFTDLTYIEYDFPSSPVPGADHIRGAATAYADVMPWIAGLFGR